MTSSNSIDGAAAQPGPHTGSGPPRRLPNGDRELIEQIEPTLELLQGKWKVHLVFLMARGVHRHCRLLECLTGASKKMMTDTLRALERDGLVHRQIYPEVPLRVEYSLTPLGWATTDLLMKLAEWHEAHGDAVRTARSSYVGGHAGESRRDRGSRSSRHQAVEEVAPAA